MGPSEIWLEMLRRLVLLPGPSKRLKLTGMCTVVHPIPLRILEGERPAYSIINLKRHQVPTDGQNHLIGVPQVNESKS
jgi:hypothetical protein